MNRKNFLKCLCALPFAAPTIVTACGKPGFARIAVTFGFVNGKVIRNRELLISMNSDGSYNTKWEEMKNPKVERVKK